MLFRSGMDEDEILRLCQITGLSGIFSDEDFSKAWEASDSEGISDDIISDDLITEDIIRTANVDDPERIFHTFDKWECAKAGFYASSKDGMKKDECEKEYAIFLSDEYRFRDALEKVISEWRYSCEHYLTNKAMNRIAWLGQAAMCYATGIPSKFCAGFNLLSPNEQDKANLIALEYLNIWMKRNNREELSMDEALSIGRQINVY